MSGLYVHIPFCARRCPYCDFAVSTQKRADFRAAYVAALRTELATILDDSVVETIHFGGGTPTELSATVLNELLGEIQLRARLGPDAEIALEANPENLELATLKELKNGGWNRISLGAQSFDAEALRFLGRAHGPEKIEETVAQAREAGFENISLDLIYGIPNQSRQSWRGTLRRAALLKTPHISAYSLTIEDGTVFGKRAKTGVLKPIEDDASADLMDDAAQILGEAGLGRYEVSNWAKSGSESRHNRNYWRGGDYLAAGCGAHGHQNGHRWWNERDAARYVERMQTEGAARAGEEWLSRAERFTELVALGLRSCEGFAWENVDFDARHRLQSEVSLLQQRGLLWEEAGRVRATAQGLAVADGLAARLLAHF